MEERPGAVNQRETKIERRPASDAVAQKDHRRVARFCMRHNAQTVDLIESLPLSPSLPPHSGLARPRGLIPCGAKTEEEPCDKQKQQAAAAAGMPASILRGPAAGTWIKGATVRRGHLRPRRPRDGQDLATSRWIFFRASTLRPAARDFMEWARGGLEAVRTQCHPTITGGGRGACGRGGRRPSAAAALAAQPAARGANVANKVAPQIKR